MLESTLLNFGDCNFADGESVREVLRSVTDKILNEVDRELIKLGNDIKSGKFSNEDIAWRIKELREIIY